MIYLFISIIVPVVVYALLPWLMTKITHKLFRRDAVLVIACLIYFISWYLPSPLIDGHNTSFTTHVVGGGIFSGFIWLYVKRQLTLNVSILMELISLFAVVCMLGVANELFELLIVKVGIVTRLTLTDTSWDLLANTLGAALFWLGFRAVARSK